MVLGLLNSSTKSKVKLFADVVMLTDCGHVGSDVANARNVDANIQDNTIPQHMIQQFKQSVTRKLQNTYR
jgi:hypothetical protein